MGDQGEETISLLGARAQKSQFTRRARYKRMLEIISIVRRYEVLHGLTPTSLRHMLEELGPTFVKAGQILSMRSEILPESFCAELSKLRTEVEPMSREMMLETLRQEYAVPIEDIFDAIDDVPLGSASVAQVHKARLVTGELVAIKVQRPGIRDTMAQDIQIMRSVARRAKRAMGDEQFLDVTSVVEELWQSFREETDFVYEAKSLEEFRRNNRDVACVTCPRAYLSLCTPHVVVMDYVEGIPLAKTSELEEAGYDIAEIGEKLVDNYASQMLDDGFFHADPHPGNILISEGAIVYIDLGIMGRLSAHDRHALSDMVFAVADLDTPRLKDGLLRFSVSTDLSSVDHAQLLSDLDVIVEDFGTTSLSELDLARFLASLLTLARRSGIELPSSVTMLARSLVTLEGSVTPLLSDQSMVEIIARHVSEDKRLLELAKDEAIDLARETRLATHGLLRAASEASLAMNMLTRGQLRLNMDVAGTDDPLADFSHAADRLTMGIVIAGLFIGSSIIYYSGIKPLLFGVPVVGFVGFFVASVLGLRLIVDIMHENHRRR
jgi:ubiquinone biosynthesis protein